MMPSKKDNFEGTRLRYWFYFGMIVFLLIALGSGIGTFDTTYLGDSIYGIVDWIAACTPYFFYAAMLGLIIDFFVYRKRDLAFKLPDWIYYTVGLIVIGFISAIFATFPKSFGEVLFSIYYPFYYGIFFTGFSYSMIPFTLYPDTILMKLLFDIILLTIFSYWMHLRLKSRKVDLTMRERRTENILLFVIFAVFTIGMVKCAFILLD